MMDLTYKADFNKLEKIKKIFFYRVCGVGMGACACLLKEKGFQVEGADVQFAPPMSDYLQEIGITCLEIKDLTDDYLKGFDLIVVGNVVPRNSEDARRLEKLGVPFTSFPEVLGKLILKDANVVGISGTHGKTTTTYLMTQVFENLGLQPGYFIGGVLDGRNSSTMGDGKFFFIEADEYDSAYFEKISKFRLYSINHLICTSLEFDHADIFNSIEDIKDEFRALLPSVDGDLIWNIDYLALRELKKEIKKKIIEYGDTSTIGPQISSQNSEGTIFCLNIDGESIEFNTNLVGVHNILNLTTCILFAKVSGFGVEKIKNAIKKLDLVKRRQEERGIYKNSLVIDDFAHHPVAVKYTIDAIRTKFKGKKINVIIEPQSATARSSIFQKEFAESLSIADSVIVARPIKSTTIKGTEDLDCFALVDDIRKNNIDSSVVKNVDEIFNHIDEWAKTDSIILVLSNGTCLGLWQTDWASALKKI